VWTAVVVLSLCLFFSFLLNIVLFFSLMARLGAVTTQQRAVDEHPALNERWSYGSGEVKAVRIPLEGMLIREADGGLFSGRYDKIEKIIRQIRAARNDEQVRAIVLEVDSPGGAITPSDEIYRALMDFRQSASGRVVVVHMRDLAASGAYYVALAGDWLIAEPTSVVGSIGVLIQALNWKEMSEKIGLTATTIKSGKNKDLLNPFEDVSPGEIELLQEIIDTMYARFVELVKSGRALDDSALDELADGRIMTATAALEAGLIDEIGYWDDVVARTRTLLEEPTVKFVRYERAPDLFEWLSEMRSPLSLSALREADIPRFMFLWRPSLRSN